MSILSVKQKIYVARLLNRALTVTRRLAGRGPKALVRRRSVNWALDINEGIDLSIYLLGSYEPQMLRAYTKLVRPGDVVFDIGANVGAHTLHFARLVGASGRVHAFEPTDFAFGKLRANLALNPAYSPVVEPNQAFLVAKRSTPLPASVYSSWPVNSGVTGLHEEHLGKPMALTGANSLTADEYCESRGINRIDVVKIDVDGHEFSVLEGFKNTLGRLRPKVLIELAPFVFDEVSPKAFSEVIESLAALDYEFLDAYSGKAVPADAAKIRAAISAGGSMNALLLPRTR
jgi:hypothetical protein